MLEASVGYSAGFRPNRSKAAAILSVATCRSTAPASLASIRAPFRTNSARISSARFRSPASPIAIMPRPTNVADVVSCIADLDASHMRHPKPTCSTPMTPTKKAIPPSPCAPTLTGRDWHGRPTGSTAAVWRPGISNAGAGGWTDHAPFVRQRIPGNAGERLENPAKPVNSDGAYREGETQPKVLIFMVSAMGLEPMTYRLKVRCSTS